MPEKTLPLPLSGEEIKKAILDRISQRLERDGYLNSALAYDWYSAKISISVSCHDVGRDVKIAITESVIRGEEPDGDTDLIEGEFEVKPKPPNVERTETGQRVPVQATGGEVKRIKYSRKAAEKAAR